jgi:hypothetical protein
MSETTRVQLRLAHAIVDVLENQPPGTALEAVLVVACCILNEVLKQGPPRPVADSFGQLRDHIFSHLRAAARANAPLN